MSSTISSKITFLDDLDEKQEEDEEMLLACVLNKFPDTHFQLLKKINLSSMHLIFS